MPPHRGHPRGITTRVYDTYMAYIFAAKECVWISTFRTTDEAARACYVAAAWRFGRARSKLNFPDV
jgi:hypothetical protein